MNSRVKAHYEVIMFTVTMYIHLLVAAEVALYSQSSVLQHVFRKNKLQSYRIISGTQHHPNYSNIDSSNLRAGFDDLVGCLISIFLEVFDEQTPKFRDFFFEISHPCPGFRRVK